MLIFIAASAPSQGVSYRLASYLVAIANAGSGVGRISCGFIADRIGKCVVPYIPVAKSCNNLPITDRPVERHDTFGIRCGHIDLHLAARPRDRRANSTCPALWRIGRRVRGTHRFADGRTR